MMGWEGGDGVIVMLVLKKTVVQLRYSDYDDFVDSDRVH
jgi:hypothetical protein